MTFCLVVGSEENSLGRGFYNVEHEQMENGWMEGSPQNEFEKVKESEGGVQLLCQNHETFCTKQLSIFIFWFW